MWSSLDDDDGRMRDDGDGQSTRSPPHTHTNTHICVESVETTVLAVHAAVHTTDNVWRAGLKADAVEEGVTEGE